LLIAVVQGEKKKFPLTSLKCYLQMKTNKAVLRIVIWPCTGKGTVSLCQMCTIRIGCQWQNWNYIFSIWHSEQLLLVVATSQPQSFMHLLTHR